MVNFGTLSILFYFLCIKALVQNLTKAVTAAASIQNWTELLKPFHGPSGPSGFTGPNGIVYETDPDP